MNIFFWVLFVFAIWFGIEYSMTDRKVRVAIQSVMILVIAVAGFTLGSISGGFSLSIQANNQVKNLTLGLLTILSKEDLDQNSLKEDLQTLEGDVIPTYEGISATEKSIAEFLEKYDIPYEN